MATYYDSSAVLAILLRQPDAERCTREWEGETVRIASILLEAECLIVLRRIARLPGPEVKASFLKERAAALSSLMEEVSLEDVHRSILEVLRLAPPLVGSRTLDALHLATALFFQQSLGEPLRVCSLDQRMRKLAQELRLEVVPTVASEGKS